MKNTLVLEDSLHDAMRDLTFGFILPRGLAAKPTDKLEEYAANGPSDDGRAAEVAWWRKYALDGVSPDQARQAFQRYTDAFQGLEDRLSDGRQFLCGDHMTIADIAWVVNINRMDLCGYPMRRFPLLNTLFTQLRARASFQAAFELEMPMPVFRRAYQSYQWLTGSTLVDIAEARIRKSKLGCWNDSEDLKIEDETMEAVDEAHASET